jgi:hypothetical protein
MFDIEMRLTKPELAIVQAIFAHKTVWQIAGEMRVLPYIIRRHIADLQERVPGLDLVVARCVSHG